jgi:hypothetical protein
VNLVQEHNDLAAAMRNGSRTGDCAEVLKALSGIYPSSFFDGCEDALYRNNKANEDPTAELRRLEKLSRNFQEAKNHREFLKAQEQEKQEQASHDAMQRYERDKEQDRRDLWRWFVKPPVSIGWQPIDEKATQEVVKHHIDSATGLSIPIAEESPLLRGGAMIEFLLPQGQLAPVLVIQPEHALQAIAGAIYAERIQGISYRKCDWCGDLFRIDRHKNKLYCDPPRPCKGNAQKQRQRAKQRNQKALAARNSQRSKSRTQPKRRT